MIYDEQCLQGEPTPHYPIPHPLLPSVQHTAQLVPPGQDPLRGAEAQQAAQLPQTVHRGW